MPTTEQANLGEGEMGWLARTYGLNMDSLESLEAVNEDGTLRQAVHLEQRFRRLCTGLGGSDP
jgi:FAD/FMN-containing dehydrogenase